jgi:hypothetical protein
VIGPAGMRDPQVEELFRMVAALEKRRVTHRTVEVTAADDGTSTFTAETPDGQQLTPVDAPAQFLPEAGQTVTLRMEGATPIYDPTGVAIGAIGDREVSSISADYIGAGLLTGEIALANRITTALEGARVEFNPLGFQKFLADGTLTISLTGDENLLTGIFKTAVSGRRVEIGASGNVGRVSMIAADGTESVLESYTEGGTESIRMVVPTAGAWEAWNGIQFQSNDRGYLSTGTLDVAVSSQLVIAWAANDGSAGVQPTRSNRLTLDETTVRFYPGALASEGSVDIQRHNVADTRLRSPRLTLRAEGGNHASHIKYVVDGDLTDPRIEVTNTADSGYGAIWASAFTVSSTEAGKTEIADLSTDTALTRLRAMRVRTYRRLMDEGALGPVEIGLVAEEAPDEVVVGQREAINLYSMSAITVAGLQRVFAILDNARTRVITLEQQVQSLTSRVSALELL